MRVTRLEKKIVPQWYEEASTRDRGGGRRLDKSFPINQNHGRSRTTKEETSDHPRVLSEGGVVVQEMAFSIKVIKTLPPFSGWIERRYQSILARHGTALDPFFSCTYGSAILQEGGTKAPNAVNLLPLEQEERGDGGKKMRPFRLMTWSPKKLDSLFLSNYPLVSPQGRQKKTFPFSLRPSFLSFRPSFPA